MASNLYINDAKISNDLIELKNNHLIKQFADVKPEIYDLVSVTNPTLKMMMDFAKRVMEVKA